MGLECHRQWRQHFIICLETTTLTLLLDRSVLNGAFKWHERCPSFGHLRTVEKYRLNCTCNYTAVRRAEIEGMMAIVVKGDALDEASVKAAFDQIEEVDAVVSTVGGTPADARADSEACARSHRHCNHVEVKLPVDAEH